MASRLADLARSQPQFQSEFSHIREQVLDEIKNADISGPTFGDQADAISKALSTIEEMMELMQPREPE